MFGRPSSVSDRYFLLPPTVPADEIGSTTESTPSGAGSMTGGTTGGTTTGTTGTTTTSPGETIGDKGPITGDNDLLANQGGQVGGGSLEGSTTTDKPFEDLEEREGGSPDQSGGTLTGYIDDVKAFAWTWDESGMHSIRNSEAELVGLATVKAAKNHNTTVKWRLDYLYPDGTTKTLKAGTAGPIADDVKVLPDTGVVYDPEHPAGGVTYPGTTKPPLDAVDLEAIAALAATVLLGIAIVLLAWYMLKGKVPA